MVCIGDDEHHTAMAKTVGLPVAIACRKMLEGSLTKRGLLLPVVSSVYNPVLEELAALGITFTENQVL